MASANRKIQGMMLRTTSLAALLAGMFTATSALAQTASEAEQTIGEVVVTAATRVVRDGYQAPTPTSVLGEAEITAKAPANLADFVNQLPSLAATNTPRANVAFVSAGLVGINALNLRSLGENRTLVLLDGQRVGASTLTGLVDVNQFPQALVKRVDVVTGGASVDWGSDAVAGVVNFVLDKDFTGVKGSVQGGVTTYGDDRNFKVSLTAGSKFADGRGHALISGEIAHSDGVTGIGDRDWYTGAKIFANPSYTATNGQPALLAFPNVGYISTQGGYIASGPRAGTYFGPGGAPRQLTLGTVAGVNMLGGDWRNTDIGESGDLSPKQSRQNVFARVSYDVSDNVEVFAQYQYGRATSFDNAISYLSFGNTIAADNAFIPAGFAGPFSLNTFAGDLGLVTATTHRSSWRGVIGARGDIDLAGSNWTWDAYWQKSANRAKASSHIPITQNFKDAIDAVRAPNGAIVCRTTLTSPNNGCTPFNPFGTGVNTQAAVDYIMGEAFGINRLKQDVVAATVRGDPFSTWAGVVSIAAGVEHRRESVTGSNDALRSANLAAGKPPPYFAGNYLASSGSYKVTEGFVEAVVPLAKDSAWAKTLDLNVGVRGTDYSTSGFVTTWKVGVTYTPIEDVTFRVTRSRDIRSPNLAELFQTGQTSTQVINDPANGNQPVTAFQVSSGNLNLKPEEADTWGVGVVLQPSFVPGFAASVDYYNIDIKDAISSVNAQTIVNQCTAGVTEFCSLVTRSGGTLTSISVSPLNFANQIARGVDFEASYRRELAGGTLSLRALATHYLKNYFNNGISTPTDTVGTNGFNVASKDSLPKWRYTASISWDRDPVAFSLTARGFSAGVQNTSWIECASACPTSTASHQTINDNSLPGATYFDGSVTLKLTKEIETFLAVDNILDKDPAEVAYGPGIGVAPLSVNPVLYDTLGRVFRVGARFRM